MGEMTPRPFRKRDATLPKGRQVEDAAVAEVEALLGEMPRRRDLLIEALHLIQDGVGHLPARLIAALAEVFRLSQVEVYEVASFYHHFDIVKEGEAPPAPLTIRICDGLSCEMAGAKRLIEEAAAKVDGAKIRIQPVPCIGRCDLAPATQIGKRAVDNADIGKLLAAVDGSKEPEVGDYEDLEAYRANGGYEVHAKIISGELDADKVIATMSDAGLRGLGGAGFPAGRKWGFVRGYEGPRLMTVNADEGEPGTFKDRYWLEMKPHRMLEGALIAAHCVGCERIYIY